MGGRNAMVFADLYPHKLRSLVIEDIGPGADPKSVHYYENMLNIIPTPFDSKESMKKYFSQVFEQTFHSKEPISVLSSFLQANIELVTEGPDIGKYDWRFLKKAIIETVREGQIQDRWGEVSRLSMPTLLVRGETSHVLKLDIYEKMLKSNPLINGIEIKQAGHWIHYEKYEEFTAILREFLGKN
jgi:pimeloyl-ACP methyl ester carboxylesterase